VTRPAVDVGALATVVWTSLVAGVVVTGTFCGALYGLARFNEAGASRASPRALAHLLLGITLLLAFVAAIVAGLLVMVGR
jgi:hypothetical protein